MSPSTNEFEVQKSDPQKGREVKVVNVLYVDDEVVNLKAFQANFRRLFNVFIARSAMEGNKILKENVIHVVLSDQRMPEITGVEFLSSVKEMYPDTIRILITAFSNIQAVIDAINKGSVYRYITKPWDMEELESIIQNAFEVYSLREENKILTESLIQANKQLEFMLRQKLLD